MPGQFNNDPSQDGGDASTTSSSKSGIFAHNDATSPAPTNVPGGNGVFGLSTVPNASGVFGANNNGGTGVFGNSDKGDGVRGRTASSANNGLVAGNDATSPAPSNVPGGNGVFGYSTVPNASGVFGANNSTGTGVTGFSAQGDGTRGDTQSSQKNGVVGTNSSTTPVPAGQQGGNGVSGYSSNPQASGVLGINDAGVGMSGFTKSASQSAIFGMNNAAGSVPDGLNRPAGGGVWGHTKVEKGSGVIGSVEPGLTQAAGVTGIGPIAGQFFGDVIVTGDIKLTGADCAEQFEIVDAGACEPGTVMVIDDSGGLAPSYQAYDCRVAGVVSGAGSLRPSLILDQQSSAKGRSPIALIGKVCCKAVAHDAPIEVGDLLTTSALSGYAMKASDPSRAFGAIIGKALEPLSSGVGLIRMLIALQ
jgi:hypothetical protein